MKRILSTLFILFLCTTAFSQTTLIDNIPGGTYSGTYTIEGDIWLEQGEQMIIEPGTRFVFQGNFKFDIWGEVQANGTEDEPIYFTTDSELLTWNGIRLDNSDIEIIGTQRFEYCIFERSHKMGSNCATNPGMADAWGGAIYIRQWRDAEFYRCRFENNQAKTGGAFAVVEGSHGFLRKCTFFSNYARNHGGALFFRYDCTGDIEGTLFEKNEAFNRGGALFSCAKDLPQMLVYIPCEIVTEETHFWGNKATNGGAIYNEASNMYLLGSSFYGNHAEQSVISGILTGGNGGAVVAAWGGNIELTSGQFEGNHADKNGGAGYVKSTGATYSALRFYKSDFDNCTAGEKGGALCIDGNNAETVLKDGSVTNCSAESGGAIAILNGAYSSNWHMKFKANSAITRGGALYFYDPDRSSHVLNSLITYNTCDMYGGGIHIQYSVIPTDVMYMESNTIAKNTALLGGGLGGELLPYNYGYYRIANTIIFENTSTDQTTNLYHDIYNIPGVLFSHCQINNAGLTGLNTSNVLTPPSFMSATDFRVHSTSAGVNAGRNSTPINIMVDLNGANRTQDVITDIGAYEDNPNNPIRMANPALSQDQTDDMLMYPNPATNDVYFEMTLNEDAKVRYEVINALGQVCKSIDEGVVAKGLYNTNLDVSDLPGGYYIVRFQINNKIELKKLTVKQ